jgi:hypothetical protein
MLITLPERPPPLKYSKLRSALEAYVLSEPTGWETTAWEATALLALTLVVALAFWLGRRSVGNVARTTVALGEVGRTPGAEVDALMAELRETINGLREQAEQAILVKRIVWSLPWTPQKSDRGTTIPAAACCRGIRAVRGFSMLSETR